MRDANPNSFLFSNDSVCSVKLTLEYPPLQGFAPQRKGCFCYISTYSKQRSISSESLSLSAAVSLPSALSSQILSSGSFLLPGCDLLHFCWLPHLFHLLWILCNSCLKQHLHYRYTQSSYKTVYFWTEVHLFSKIERLEEKICIVLETNDRLRHARIPNLQEQVVEFLLSVLPALARKSNCRC